MKNKTILFAAAVALASSLLNDAYAQTPGFSWARRVAKTQSTDDELAMGLAVDWAGNSYVTAWFDGTNDFGGTTLVSAGDQDIFVAKYNSGGVLLWVRQAGGTNTDLGRGVGVDASGNVYVTGGFRGTAKFGNTNLNSGSSQDCFLAKYDSTGVLQWVRQDGGGGGGCYGTGIAVDCSGNCCVVGYFDGPSVTIGSNTFTAGHYEYSIFVAKYDRAGTALWAQAIAGPGATAYATGIAVDGGGNCFVAGSFDHTVTLGTNTLTSAGARDAFVAKYNAAGTCQWARRAGGTGKDGTLGLAVDRIGNTCVAGAFSGTAAFGSTNLTSVGAMDIFVAKYNPNGGLTWVQKAGGVGTDYGSASTIGVQGQCQVMGSITAPATFGTVVQTNSGLFVANYNADGQLNWVETTGNAAISQGIIRLDGAANSFIASWFQSATTIGTNILTGLGYRDVFLAKLGSVQPMPVTLGIGATKSMVTLTLAGNTNCPVCLSYADELVNGENEWMSLTNTPLPSSPYLIVDPSFTNASVRFYRAALLP